MAHFYKKTMLHHNKKINYSRSNLVQMSQKKILVAWICYAKIKFSETLKLVLNMGTWSNL